MYRKMDRMEFCKLCGKYAVTIESSSACIVDMDGPVWTVDTENPVYPPKLFDGDDSIPNDMSIVGNEEAVNIFQRNFIADKYGENSQEYADVDNKIKDSHVEFPAKPPNLPKEDESSSGVGTELKKLLSYIGIRATPNCSCNQKAKVMDKKGIEWCEENEKIILDWLEEEAKKRRLPFLRFGAKKILKLAISRAKKVGV